MGSILMNKKLGYIGLGLVVLYVVLSGDGHKKAVEHLELAYINANNGKDGYAVNCDHKEVNSRNWVLCESHPVKNAGLWEIVGTEYLASNGKALSAMNNFKSSEFVRNPSAGSLSEVMSAFDG